MSHPKYGKAFTPSGTEITVNGCDYLVSWNSKDRWTEVRVDGVTVGSLAWDSGEYGYRIYATGAVTYDVGRTMAGTALDCAVAAIKSGALDGMVA